MGSNGLRYIPDYINAADDFNYGSGVAGTTQEIFQGGVTGIANQFVARVSFQLNFANYTSVTVKAQARVHATSGNWEDISGATTSADNDIVTFNTMGDAGPYSQYRLHTTATLSGSTDTLDVTIVEETRS